jgi:predicted amidohydrolase
MKRIYFGALALVLILTSAAFAGTAVVGFVDVNRYGQIYNALAVLADGEIKGVYRKRALPNYGVFFEKRYFISGEPGLFDFEGNPLHKDIFNIDGLLFGINDCEDIWVEKDGGFYIVKGKKVETLVAVVRSHRHQVHQLVKASLHINRQHP